MPLELDFGGAAPLGLNDAFLLRGMGAPVQWHFIAELKPDEYGGDQEAQFVRTLLKGPVTVKAKWQPEGFVVCPGAKVVGVSRPGQSPGAALDWKGYTGRIDIFAHGTDPKPTLVSPFVPRRRVHHANNMAELMNSFSHIATPLPQLQSKLTGLEFPDKGNSSIIQNGVSDWDFFGQMLDQCRLLAPPGADWVPLGMLGSVDENGGTAGRWVVTPALSAPYTKWNFPADRKLTFVVSDGPERFQFGQRDSDFRVPQFSSGSSPTVGIGRPWRTFDSQRWDTWRKLDLPRYTEQGEIVWQMQDRISRGPQDSIGWETFYFASPPEAQPAGPFLATRPVPWVGTGKVKATDSKGPWIHVTLDGFEDKANVAAVRLSTPFSGTDGKKGLHFVPEEGTDVELCWPGRFDASVVLVGNTRDKAADFASPSIYLQATHTAHYEAVHFKKIGEVSIDSSLSVGIKQNTSVTSQQPLKIHADGADFKMNGGIVYTGRGM